jgi:hypothetical protein
MTSYSYRAHLTWLWVVSFVLVIMGVLYLRVIVRIGPDASSTLFDLVLAQYVPYLGAIVAFHFAARTARQPATKGQIVPYRVAMLLSLLWNLTVVVFVVQACSNPDLTEDATADIKKFVPPLSWAVAPAIGFFFGKPAEEKK